MHGQHPAQLAQNSIYSVMHPSFTTTAFVLLIGTLSLAPCDAHSWLDALFTDDVADKIFGEDAATIILGGDRIRHEEYASGYGRNYPTRGAYNINTAYTCKIQPTNNAYGAQPVCCNQEGSDQTTGKNAYHDMLKMLKAQAGQTVHFLYSPNGHIAKDGNGKGTLMKIFWTGVAGKEFTTVDELTDDMAISPGLDFDDGKCGETCTTNDKPCKKPSGRKGDYKPCFNKFKIPSTAKPGVYPMAWIWDFRGVLYTTCFDVQVIAGDDYSSSVPVPTPAQINAEGEDTNDYGYTESDIPSPTVIPERNESSISDDEGNKGNGSSSPAFPLANGNSNTNADNANAKSSGVRVFVGSVVVVVLSVVSLIL